MRPKLFLPFLFVCSFSFAQQPLTTDQINRLADAGKVYGYIKYFHPWLQYKDTKWDSAFAANVEEIINANNRNEYATVMQNLLSSLNDGLTTVANINGNGSNYQEQPLTYNVKDSILYVQMNDAPFMITDDALSKALQNLNNVRGAVIDMRKPVNSQYYVMAGPSGYFDWNTSFFKGVNNIPSIRTVSYTGFPSEWGSGYNNAIFKEPVVVSASGQVNKEVPLVFIVAKEDEIPLIAIKLQEKGKSKILQEDERDLMPGSSLYFYISDNLLIQMRTGEAVNTDGSLLIVKPDGKFKHGDSLDVVLEKAKNLLTNDKFQMRERSWLHPMPEDRTSPYTNGSAYPSIGYRMLAASKMFIIIDHFYASKNGMTKNWEVAYKEAIPKFVGASDSLEYWKAVAEFHAYTQDSHGFVSKSNEGFSLRLNPVIQERGAFMPPVFTSLIENKIVVTGIYNESVCRKIGISKGDIILSIDGEDVLPMVEKARKFQNAGNVGSQNFYLGSFILFGNKEQVKKLKIQDIKGRIKQIMMPTLDEFKGNWMADKYVSGMFAHNHQPVAKYLDGDIIYADLTSGLDSSHIDSIYKWAKNAKGIIIDMRGYPQGAQLPSNLTIESMFFEKIRKITPEISYKLTANLPASSPNIISVNRFGSSFPAEQYQTEYLTKDKNFELPIKLVVLTNGSAQSSGDYRPFIYRSMYNATIIGSPTAGAMSAFTNYHIPGNIRLWLSWRAIDRKGIHPDIFVQPTIKGIQASKDEVLERAIKFLQTGK